MASASFCAVVKNVTSLLAALGYALEQLAKVLAIGGEISGAARADEAEGFSSYATTEFEPETDEPFSSQRDLRFLCDTVERVNQRYLDEIRSFDHLSGLLLGAIVVLLVYLIELGDTVTLTGALILLVPLSYTGLNFGGNLWFSPNPAPFQYAFTRDPVHALENLIKSHKRDIKRNADLRNRKRKRFNRSLGIFIVVFLVTMLVRGYNVNSESKGPEVPEAVAAEPGYGSAGGKVRHGKDQVARSPGEAKPPDGLQLRLCRRSNGHIRSGDVAYQTVDFLVSGPRGGKLPTYISPAGSIPIPPFECTHSGGI